MAMTKRESLAKEQLMKVLAQEGYPTYASLLDLFHVNLTDDPGVVAYMEPGKARIVVNSGLDIDQVSTIVRHEILHEYLNHHKRLINKLAKEHNLDPDKLDDLSVKELNNELFSDQLFNIAGDYEISNRGYTDKDKQIARSIRLNGQKLQGLVTEDEHPEWVDMSIEDMYDELRKLQKQDQQQNGGGRGAQGRGDGEDSQGNKSNSSRSNKQGSGGIRIGDKGSKEIQDAEQAAREAEDVTKELEDSEGKKNLEKEIESAKKDLDDAKKSSDKKSEAERVKEILDKLNDLNAQANAMRELDNAISKEQAAKAVKNAEKMRKDPLNNFIINLNHFIKNEVATSRGATWKRMNKKYQDSGIIRKGTSRLANEKIPSINVYFDRSGSWGDAKIQVGMKAIATLNKYVQKGDIKIKLYYFANRVGDNPNNIGGGTEGQPIMDHIKVTKPDNVIIMTDSDINDIETPTTVPGAVWLLFKGGESENLINNIHGRKQTKKYDI